MRLIFRLITEFVPVEDAKLFAPNDVSACMCSHRPNCSDQLF